VEYLPQEGADLGERMANAFDFSFAAGYGPVLLRGSDTPDLPASIIYEAQEALAREKADLVLGPAADGGYYLIGLSQPAPRLFEDIAWSTPGVLDATLQLATGMGLTVHLLPGWRDIDTPEDLLAFLQRSRMAPAPGWRSRAAAAELLGLAYTDNSPNILK
jgi:rSAM/selenodomain-associated transferase 1